MTKLHVLLLAFLSTTMFSSSASAANYYPIGPVVIADVSAIQVPFGGHVAGTLEVRILNGYTIPSGATCTDRFYLATLKNVDADKRMLALLTTAQVTKQPVNLVMTDDPAATAFAGRCSLAAVTLTQ